MTGIVCSKTYKIKGWSQAGLVVFFKIEVLNLCGGSSNCITHRGFTLPTNTADNRNISITRNMIQDLTVNSLEYLLTADHIKCADARLRLALVASSASL